MSRAVAAWQRRRASALREVADHYIAEADAAPESKRVSILLRKEAALMVSLADHADTSANLLAQQAALAISRAADADERAGEGRRGTVRKAR